MTTEPKKSRIAHVPSILVGTAAVIAAASTLYVNVRHDAESSPAAAVTMQSTPAASSSASTVASSAKPASRPTKLLLRLDRVQVVDDGSTGTTDWTFQISVDGDPLYSVPMPALDDTPGENLARPADREQASAEVELRADKTTEVSVNGWKKSWMPGSRGEVSGKAWLGASKTVVAVGSDKEKGPRFVLYFTATTVE